MKVKFIELLEFILLSEHNKEVLGFIEELVKDDYYIVSKKALGLLMKLSLKDKKNYTGNILQQLYCKLNSGEE